jgi:hypothetical protein
MAAPRAKSPESVLPRTDEDAHAHDHALAPTEEASYRMSTVAGWAVSACAVHCVLLPFAGLVPLLGSSFFASPWFEWTFVAFAAVVGGFGVGISYWHVHLRPGPLLAFVAGLGVLIFTHLFLEGRETLHAAGAVAGAGVILIAARMNHRLVHGCQRCHPHPHGKAPEERPA